MQALSSIVRLRTFALLVALVSYSQIAFAQFFFKNINSDSGLSSSSINAIFRDKQGYLWVGTNFGLNRYDGYNMKVFKQDLSKPNSIKNNYINSILQDADGILWVHTKTGMSVYDYNTETFENDYKKILISRNITDDFVDKVICSPHNTAHIVNNYDLIIYNHTKKTVVKVEKKSKDSYYHNGYFDLQDNLWMLDTKQNLYKINSQNGKILSTYKLRPEKTHGNSFVYVDKRNKIWININSAQLYYLDPKTSKLIDFRKDIKNSVLNNYPIRAFVEDNYNRMWIGTDHGGIVLLNPQTFESTIIKENEKQDLSLAENSITALCADKDGAVWIGTFKQGVDYYHPLNRRFSTNKIPGTSGNNDINCFVEDNAGNVFIGTNGYGLYKYNLNNKTYTAVNYSGNSNKDKTIVSLLFDSKNRLWIGTYGDGLYCYDKNKFVHYINSAESPARLPDNDIWSLVEDKNKNIWIGTLNSGLFRFDEKNAVFTPHKLTANTYVCIESAIRDKDNNLLFGSTWGIYMLNPNGQLIKQIDFKKNNDGYAERNFINSIAQDKAGYYWVATQSGLAVVDGKSSNYRFFSNETDLDNKLIYMVLVDKSNKVWASTTNGLYLIDVNNYGKNIDEIEISVIRFSKDDGLQDNKFNGKSAYRTKSDKLFFGGINGFNIIDAQRLNLEKQHSNLVLTNLYINSTLIPIGQEFEGRILLEKSLNNTSEITLKYYENNLKIGFSALSFLHPENNKYEYMLEGFDENWNILNASEPSASYNNLSRGKYIFKVRLKQNGQFIDSKTISLIITVKPPFWLSWPAFLLYFTLIVGIAIFIYRYLVERATFELRLSKEHQERQHVEEISAMKVKFFTNLSHELRTPVSLIILPVENMLSKTLDNAMRNNLTMVLRNAKRLLFIVNQLLDFRKLEVGEITYHPVLGNIVTFIKDVTLPFMDIAQNKNIKLTVKSNVEELYTNFDHNKLERILFNLLSNAFKFTPNRGNVEVAIHYIENNPLPIRIEVSDSGIGIEAEKISNIFKPFYQVENQGAIANMGTGIGLSITYEFVRLHNGNIRVESAVDKGTTFIIELPMLETHSPVIKEDLPEEELIISTETMKIPTIDSISKKSRSILIVDDNDDFRFYLVENLRGLYNVIEACNGKSAYEKANQFLPDIIVSDVTMPEMDGIELCKQLKTEVNTSHIPIILLTANTLSEDKISGFEAGADEYISKPFNVGVLKARIRNLLLKKDEQRSKLNAQSGIEISEIKLPTLDEKLLEKVNKYTLENIANTEFGIDELSKMIGMSSVYLNKKISILTGKTTSEYVRSIRLRKAAQLLEKSDLSISEVAYEVGYNSPKYFSKYFKDEYGILPSEYRKNYV